MNPALLHNPYHNDYSLNTDNKYLGQNRTYSNPPTLTSSDYPYLSRRDQAGLTNTPLSQTLSTAANSGLEYNPHQSISDHSSFQSALLLSPPSSVDGSHSANLQHSTSLFGFAGGPKSATSNASATEQFPASISQFQGPVWNDTTMTDLRQERPSVLHPSLSSHLSYNPASGSTSQFFSPHHRPMEPFSNPYALHRSFNAPEGQHGILSRDIRAPSFHQLPMPTPSTYPVNNSYTPMTAPPPQPGRPEGPPFDETKIVHQLVTTRQQSLQPEISASIQKGFFQVEGKWTCYRRNYFAVTCSFTFKHGIPDGSVYLQRSSHSQLELVRQYGISISAKTANGNSQESESRQLIQHTPKRDKATEKIPGRHIVQPAPLQSLHAHALMPNSSLYPGGSHVPPGIMSNYDGFGTQSHLSVPTSYTFERIQFQKATANNGKRRAQQQYFHVVVELSVNVGRSSEENWVVIATRQSQPMVVRGRSPGHYKDNIRRDGQTNLDHDRTNGPGHDGGLTGAPFMGTNPSLMDWSATQRQGGFYSGGYTRYSNDSEYTPDGTSPSTTMTGSPDRSSMFQVGDVPLPKLGSPYLPDRPTLHLPDFGKCGAIEHRPVFFERKRSDDDEDEETFDNHEFYTSHVGAEDTFSSRAFGLLSGSSTQSLRAA